MINSIEVYKDAGAKHGRAARNWDAGLMEHWDQWVRRALRLENPEDREIARKAYNDAYTAECRRGRHYF